MTPKKPLRPQDKTAIVKAYENLEPMISIANRYHKSRNAIYGVLKRAGVDTSKRKLQVTCAACGKIKYIHKSQIRKRKKHFCNQDCFLSFISSPEALIKQAKTTRINGQRKITDENKKKIIKAYENNETAISLGDEYGISRGAIISLLKKANVDTSGKKKPVACKTCGKIKYVPKCKLRKNKNHFCDDKCYKAFLEAGASHLTPTENRRGSKRARKIVAQYFDLQSENIVHHEDRFNLNNQLWNLRVFKNQADHIRYHRGFDTKPIWNGTFV